MGLECRSSTGLGEAEIPLLEGAHTVSHALGTKGKAVTPSEPGPDLPAGTGASPGEAEIGCGSLWGQGHCAEATGKIDWHELSWRLPF